MPTRERSFTVDASEPSPSNLQITNPPEGATIDNSSVTVIWTIDNYYPVERGDYSNLYLDGNLEVSNLAAKEHSVTDLSEGSHTVTVEVYEGSGGGTSASASTGFSSDGGEDGGGFSDKEKLIALGAAGALGLGLFLGGK